ncbi:hypothetical protein ANDA3_2300 [plant metagenome]|uniref:YtkA-like domain-containing protein n=1 Tax=plant metagenome TaxID=1297885 RepID=A0A484UIK2_9ZZZZ
MKMRFQRCAIGALLAVTWLGSAWARPAITQAGCTPAPQPLMYDCRVVLADGGQPVTGAVFTLTADMPAMPMAHHVPAVPAEPTGTAGEYRATVRLEMPGTWTLKLRVTRPAPDLLLRNIEIGAHGKPQDATSAHAGH